MDPRQLVGAKLDEIRDSSRIQELDHLLRDGKLHMMTPLNLKEGWVGVSLIFGVARNGIYPGYIAAVLNLKAVLDYEAINETRNISHALMPAVPENYRLIAAIEHICELLKKKIK